MHHFRKPKPLRPVYQYVLEKVENGDLDSSKDELTTNVLENERILRSIFTNCSDVVFRKIPNDGHADVLVVYIDGLIDMKVLDQTVLEPLLFTGLPQGLGPVENIAQALVRQLVAVAQTKTVSKIRDIEQSILKANVAILSNGEKEALIADIKGHVARAVEEPSAEISIRGPREGFTETIRTNISLLRRKICSSRLKMEPLILGEVSQTEVAITYIEGIVNQAVLEEVRKRVGRIQIDAVLESGYIEEFIEDETFSPFPQVQNTERPDVVAASLLEGKVAIFVDGTPFTMVVPMTFWSALQAAEDYYHRWMYATFVRWLRFMLLIIALLLPSTYVAITTFHPQMLPANLLITFSAAREPSPFPSVVEALMMEFMFEALREAGIRLPKAVGSAVSIVGALVIGQAAVDAGIISAPIVIVVATTGISSFAIPRYNFGIAFRMIRFPMLLLAGILGFYGIVMGLLVLLIHVTNLRSFGVPYFTPIAPQIQGNLKDVLLRVPRWSMGFRPALIAGKDTKRIPEGQQPQKQRKKDREP